MVEAGAETYFRCPRGKMGAELLSALGMAGSCVICCVWGVFCLAKGRGRETGYPSRMPANAPHSGGGRTADGFSRRSISSLVREESRRRRYRLHVSVGEAGSLSLSGCPARGEERAGERSSGRPDTRPRVRETERDQFERPARAHKHTFAEGASCVSLRCTTQLARACAHRGRQGENKRAAGVP